jgi:hypothetical protein
MKCKTCGKEFHYCKYCSQDIDADHGFCSRKCLENSESFKVFKNIFDCLTSKWDKRTFEIIKHIYEENEFYANILINKKVYNNEIQN